MECEKAVGGIVNCCEGPSGVSLADYITLVMAMIKLDGAITSWFAPTGLRRLHTEFTPGG